MENMTEMTDVIIATFGIKVAAALTSFILIWILLRFLDKLSGIDFKARMGELDNMEFALYAGLRLIALCLLVGMVMS